MSYLSYKQILQDRLKFRQAGGPNGSDFNNFDMPGAMYFRILFHFFNKPTDQINSDKDGAGLLHPTWLNIGTWAGDGAWVEQRFNKQRAPEYNPWNYNTAYSYLMTNDEQERAIYLKQFISLLSNINSESPWYFKSVKGIEEAINRKQLTETFEFKERGRLTIECMPDSFDQRIATLLDLYRAATYSWVNKREIIPANLRKFDMSVVVYQVPVLGMHQPWNTNPSNILGQISSLIHESDINYATMDWTSKGPPIASYKVYEFHNCEFDYNSSTAGGDGLVNEEPFQTAYNIGIFYDDMYESRHNEFMPVEKFTISTRSRAATKDMVDYQDKQVKKELSEAQAAVDRQEAKIKADQARDTKLKELQANVKLKEQDLQKLEEEKKKTAKTTGTGKKKKTVYDQAVLDKIKAKKDEIAAAKKELEAYTKPATKTKEQVEQEKKEEDARKAKEKQYEDAMARNKTILEAAGGDVSKISDQYKNEYFANGMVILSHDIMNNKVSLSKTAKSNGKDEFSYENYPAVEDTAGKVGQFLLTEITDLVLVDSVSWANQHASGAGGWDAFGEPQGIPSPDQIGIKSDETYAGAINTQIHSLMSKGFTDNSMVGNLFGLSVDDIDNYQSITDQSSASVLKFNYNGYGDPDDLPENIFKESESSAIPDATRLLGNMFAVMATISNT